MTGNTRNAALREMLQTTAKVTKTSVPTKLNRTDQKIMQIIKDGKPASFGKDCEEIINTGLLVAVIMKRVRTIVHGRLAANDDPPRSGDVHPPFTPG